MSTVLSDGTNAISSRPYDRLNCLLGAEFMNNSY
jgi:hypothetical protein